MVANRGNNDDGDGVNIQNNDGDGDDDDDASDKAKRSRGKPKPSWKRTFFKDIGNNRLQCLLTPDPTPSKGGTHRHEPDISNDVGLVLALVFINLFSDDFSQLTVMERHLFGSSGSAVAPMGHHAKDIMHFNKLVSEGKTNEAAAVAVLGSSASRNSGNSMKNYVVKVAIDSKLFLIDFFHKFIVDEAHR